MARPKSDLRRLLEAAVVGRLIVTDKTYSSVRQIVGKLNKTGKHFNVICEDGLVKVTRVV